MDNLKVISREYKLVLKAKKFTGNEADFKNRALIFWQKFKKAVKPVTIDITGSLNTIDKRRQIRFYDTKKVALFDSNYIFRERKDLEDNETEVTLKFRHGDRYVAQGRNMDAKNMVNAKTKFEEDIKAPFTKLYSYSTTQPIDDIERIKQVENIIELYPGLSTEVEDSIRNDKIMVAQNLLIAETVLTGGNINLGGDPVESAECGLIIWHKKEAFKGDPLIVEFSFRYGSKKEEYSREVALNAYKIFTTIQEEMKSWIDANDATKTGFVFG